MRSVFTQAHLRQELRVRSLFKRRISTSLQPDSTNITFAFSLNSTASVFHLQIVQAYSTRSPGSPFSTGLRRKRRETSRFRSEVVRGRESVSRRDDLASLDLTNTRFIVIRDEPVNGVLEAPLERRELELFVILARLAHEPDQFFVRCGFAELSVRLGRVELLTFFFSFISPLVTWQRSERGVGTASP